MNSMIIHRDDSGATETPSLKADHRFNKIATAMLLGAFGLTFFLSLFPDFYYFTGGFLFIAASFLAISLLITKIALLSHLPESARQGRAWKLNWKHAALALILLWTSIYFQLPLKFGFLTIHSKLEKIAAETDPHSTNILTTDIKSLLYHISATRTNERSHDRSNPAKILFTFANDWESAFIYSPTGIDDLTYNSGNAGHLFGHWYWMKED